MKSKELSKLRNESVENLDKLVAEKKKELGLSYADRKVGKEKNSSISKNLRRDIAQIMTIIRESEIAKTEAEKVKKVKGAK